MPRSLPPIPRRRDDDHSAAAARERLDLCEHVAGRPLPGLGGAPVAPELARGKVENFVGFAQVPVGIAGPLAFQGAGGPVEVYVPMATTEGAMVASYGRGMKVLREAAAGGTPARARVIAESLSQHPVLVFARAEDAVRAAAVALEERPELERLTASLSAHGRLAEVRPEPVGRRLVLRLTFTTGDAIGINMAARAADACSRRVAERTGALERYVHGEDVEKRANARALVEGRGRSVVCDVVVPRDLVVQHLRVEPVALARIQRTYAVGFARLGTQNHLLQAANGLVAVFIACGQDAAYVTESATGLLELEVTAGGDLYACVFLPSLLVGTVGGGSGQGTAAECLDLMGVRGAGGANRFAEILAATVLAGDLSLMASFVAHDFVDAHERLGRNRPDAGGANRPA